MFSPKYICYVWKDNVSYTIHGPYLSVMSFTGVQTYDAFLYVVFRVTEKGIETIEIGGTSTHTINSPSGV